MADVSDVQDALVTLIGAVLYPSGTGSPSITALPTLVYGGWPQGSQLDSDMLGFTNGQGGRIHVTVFPTATEKNSTRYFPDYGPVTVVPPTITLTKVGQTITLTGTISTPQNIALLINNLPYVYAVQAGDTLTTAAAGLAALVAGATSAGAVITIPVSGAITAARAGGSGTAIRFTRTMERTCQITIWADTPANRTATAKAIDTVLSGTEWITFPDGTGGHLKYGSTHIDDMVQKANLYRRDLMYSVEYSTVQSVNATQVVITEQKDSITGPDGNPVLVKTNYQ
jgi:hypothetical protein